MRTSNFAVNNLQNKANNGQMAVGENSMPASMTGIIVKSAIYGLITIAATLITYFIMNNALATGDADSLNVLLILAAVAGVPMFILSLVIGFVPRSAMICGFIYTALQGILLGVMVCLIDLVLPGISLVAVLGTGIVFVVALLLNKVLEVRISSGFLRGVVIAFISLLLVSAIIGVIYAVNPSFAAYWWLEIIISAICIILATIMLMGNLQSADAMVAGGIDKSYEWNVSFAIVTTLIYIYVEILELLIRLAAIFGRNKN